jgi:cell shape-determining protein MreD
MRASAVLFLTLFLLQTLVAEANHALSGAHVWLFTGGLFVAYAALMAPFNSGFFASILGGLLCDAVSPVAFGTHTVLFAAAHAGIYNIRERMQRDETAVRVGVALLLNAVLFVAVTLVRLRHVPAAATVWPRLLSDLVWSEGAVALIAPWFFALQVRSLELARAIPARSA